MSEDGSGADRPGLRLPYTHPNGPEVGGEDGGGGNRSTDGSGMEEYGGKEMGEPMGTIMDVPFMGSDKEDE